MPPLGKGSVDVMVDIRGGEWRTDEGGKAGVLRPRRLSGIDARGEEGDETGDGGRDDRVVGREDVVRSKRVAREMRGVEGREMERGAKGEEDKGELTGQTIEVEVDPTVIWRIVFSFWGGMTIDVMAKGLMVD